MGECFMVERPSGSLRVGRNGGCCSGWGWLNRTGFPGDSISWEIMESWED